MVFQFSKLLPKHRRVLDSKSHRLPHYIYSVQEMEKIKITHLQPKKTADKMAYGAVKLFRFFYDAFTRYDLERMTEHRWINRCIFLETIAGVPGMVGGMARHLKSIRRFQNDKGFIHHLLEQADNQRFHLFLFLHMKNPGKLLRMIIIIAQGVFMNMFFLSYLIQPRFCHRFVGYLQQEAVKTYTTMLAQIDRQNSIINKWSVMKAPQEAIEYYHLDKNATMRDVILSIRTDESTHRQTNHFLAQVEKDYQMQEQDIYKRENQEEEWHKKK